jgi:iron(III) transport system ATP-binding protein
MPTQLEVRDVTVAYGGKPVVAEVSFVLDEGVIGCLLGPSGCGKTTLLRAIAGFEPVTAGEIWLNGRRVSSAGETLAPERRRVGMVFQDFALFPHLSVEGNIGFGLRGLSRAERRRRVGELLELVGMADVGWRYPHQLSGGMQQRVALARAMAPRPDILLLDEPFASMDTELRESLAREVRDLLKRDGVTAVLVTHDQLEAFAMADQIAVLGGGRVHQWGTGFGLYHEPANRFVADFIGQGVLLPGTVVDDLRVKTELGRVAGSKPHGLAPGQAVEVLIRPDDMLYDESSPRRATVAGRAFRGAEYLYTLKLGSGTQVLCLVPSHHQHALGDDIGVRLEADHLVVFPVGAGAAPA